MPLSSVPSRIRSSICREKARSVSSEQEELAKIWGAHRLLVICFTRFPTAFFERTSLALNSITPTPISFSMTCAIDVLP